MTRCPFIDPNFEMEIDDPCPVCGMTGHIWAEKDKCVGNVIDTGDDFHQILGDALKTADRKEG